MNPSAGTAFITLSVFGIVASILIWYAPPEYLPYWPVWFGGAVALTVLSVIASCLLFKADEK